MKKSIETMRYKFMLLMLMLMNGVYAIAQNGGGASPDVAVKTSTQTTSTDFVIEPWMWVVGAAVLILLLAMVLGGGSSHRTNDKTTIHRTTVTRKDDVYDA